MCCIRRFVPLTLAWATTIHKCQGTEAGKTEPPRPPNPCKRVIVDMGNTGFEKRTPGVAYVAMSRANTLGKGNIMESAIYFMGNEFTKERLTDMTKSSSTKETTEKCKRRANWINHLEDAVHGVDDLNEDEKQNIIDWATDTKLSNLYSENFFQDNLLSWI